MPFTEAELYILRDFNELTEDEAYQTAVRLLSTEMAECAALPIPQEHVIDRHDWPTAPPNTLLFDVRCYGLHYAVQIIGTRMVRVSEIDIRNYRERIMWRLKKRVSYAYPFPPSAELFSD
jgi:hypothetical protein